jgi:hypothetical protein
VADAASAMDVGLSTMTRWVKQLRDRAAGKNTDNLPMPRNKLKSVSSGKSYNVLKWKMKWPKEHTVDSIGQRNSYVKTWGCGGFLNETNIYSRGKSLCF